MVTRAAARNLQPLGYFKYAAGSIDTAQSITPPPGAGSALIRNETQSVRWRDDDVNPTATVGMLMLAADAPLYYAGDLTKLRVIAATAGAILHVVFYS